MVIASGYIELNSEEMMNSVLEILKKTNVEITKAHEDRIVFLIERESSAETKNTLESLKNIDGVRNVYLAYFSLEASENQE